MIVTSQWKGFPDFSKNDSANFNMEASEKKKTTQYVSFPTEFVWAKTNTKREQRSSPCLTHKATLNSPWWPGFAEVSRSYWAPRVRVFCMSLVTRGACMGKPWVELENTWRPCRGPVGVFFLTSGSWTSCIKLHKLGFFNPFFCWMGGQSIWKSLKIFGHFETDMIGYYVSFHFHVVLFRIQVILDRLETFFHIRHVLVTKAIYSNQTFGISYPSEGEISLGRLSGWRIRRVTAGLV